MAPPRAPPCHGAASSVEVLESHGHDADARMSRSELRPLGAVSPFEGRNPERVRVDAAAGRTGMKLRPLWNNLAVPSQRAILSGPGRRLCIVPRLITTSCSRLTPAYIMRALAQPPYTTMHVNAYSHTHRHATAPARPHVKTCARACVRARASTHARTHAQACAHVSHRAA